MPKLVFTLPSIDKPGGTIKIEVQGGCGESCKLLTQPYEQRLGTVVKSEDKPELYEQRVETTVQEFVAE